MLLCHSYSCISLGNHTLYFSLDTSSNLMLMEGNISVNICTSQFIVPGQVGCFLFVSTSIWKRTSKVGNLELLIIFLNKFIINPVSTSDHFLKFYFDCFILSQKTFAFATANIFPLLFGCSNSIKTGPLPVTAHGQQKSCYNRIGQIEW